MAEQEKPGLILRILMSLDPAIFFTIMLIAKFIGFLIDIPLGLIFGFTIRHGRQEEHKRSKENYEASAQLVDIIGRGTLSFASSNSLFNFFVKHNKYVHPNYVLDKDHITLQGVTKTHVYFCVSAPDKDVYMTSDAPFVFIFQYFFAQQLVIMPLTSFHRLADEIGDPKAQLIFAGHTGRCGSTLVCQMLARLDNARVMSEPHGCCLHILAMYNRGEINQETMEKLLRSSVRLQAKSLRNEVEFVMIKFPMLCSSLFPLLKKVFPNCKVIFVSRHPKPSLTSFYSIVSAFGGMYSFTREARRFWFVNLGFPLENERLQKFRKTFLPYKYLFDNNRMYDLGLGYAGSMICYKTYKPIFDYALCYEDLSGNFKDEAAKLFQALGISTDMVEEALKALKKHSQNDLWGTTDKKKTVTEEQWKSVDKAFAEVGLPFPSNCTIEEFKEGFLGRN